MGRVAFIAFAIAAAFYETRYADPLTRYFERHLREDLVDPLAPALSIFVINLTIILFGLFCCWVLDERPILRQMADSWRDAYSSICEERDELAEQSVKKDEIINGLMGERDLAKVALDQVTNARAVDQARFETLKIRHDDLEGWSSALAEQEAMIRDNETAINKAAAKVEEARSELTLWRADVSAREAAVGQSEAFLAAQTKDVADRSAALVTVFGRVMDFLHHQTTDLPTPPDDDDPEMGGSREPYSLDPTGQVQKGSPEVDRMFHPSERTVDTVNGAIKTGPYRNMVFGNCVIPIYELEIAIKHGWRVDSAEFTIDNDAFRVVTRA